ENPRYDPHGAPIPTSSGEIEATDSYTLADLGPGEEAQVRAVRDDDSAGLLAVEAAGLLPGTRVRVLDRTRTPPILKVEVEGAPPSVLEVALTVARRVYVIPASPGRDR
ncbi:MAG: FeoA family protein, partial [Gemmatimonadota bacterium]